MTDLENALAKIEEALKVVREHDELGAHDIQEAVDKVRVDSITEELDSARAAA